MLNDLIVCRSLTYAQRTAAVLKQAGITAWLVRTPREIHGNGCGYSVRVPHRSAAQAVDILGRNQISIQALYAEETAGSYREEPL